MRGEARPVGSLIAAAQTALAPISMMGAPPWPLYASPSICQAAVGAPGGFARTLLSAGVWGRSRSGIMGRWLGDAPVPDDGQRESTLSSMN
jgi:hypothetical protein